MSMPYGGLDDAPECIHGLGLVSACVICNGRAAKERAEEKTVDYWFDAGFDSRLACGHQAVRGDRLARMKNDTIICEECATHD